MLKERRAAKLDKTEEKLNTEDNKVWDLKNGRLSVEGTNVIVAYAAGWPAL